MFGKGSLIFVIGFALVFSVYQLNLNRLASGASDNFNEYYIETLVHESAMSAMNMAINEVWVTDDTTSASFTVQLPPCTSVVTLQPSGGDTVMVKVVTRSSVFTDEALQATSEPLAVIDSMHAVFSFSLPITRYFWYTNANMGMYWTSGDTVWGPMHTNGTLRTNGEPVFYGKVSASKFAPMPDKGGNKAEFLGGWEAGVEVDLPTDMSSLINEATSGNGGAAMNTKSLYDTTLTLEFLANGQVVRTLGLNPGVDPTDTVAVTDIAPTGVLYNSEDIYVHGVFNGQATFYSGGSVHLIEDLTYADNPITNPSSDDFLGLVGQQDVLIDYLGATPQSAWSIAGSLLAVDGTFKIEKLEVNASSDFVLSVVGSVAANVGKQVGEGSISGVAHSYTKKFYYDDRLMQSSPPHFPGFRALHLVSWWE